MTLELSKYKNQFSIFLLILLSSKTTILEVNDLIVAIIFSFYFFIILRKNILPKNFYWVVFVLFSLPFIYLFKFGSIQIYTFLGFILKFLLSYFIVLLDKEYFIKNFISVVYKLTFLGLPIFFIEQLVPDLVHYILKIMMNLYEPLLNFDIQFGEYYSIFFYNSGERHFNRNAGFMWEPSAFSVFLLIAISFNSILDRRFFSKKNIILILGIITSFSTTAYLLFPLAILPYFIKFTKFNLFKLVFSLICVSLIINFFINSEIIGEKISFQFSNQSKGLDYSYIEYSKNGIYGLSRFASILVDLPKLIDNPFFGLGVDLSESTSNSIYYYWGKEFRRSNGLMLLFLKFGILLTSLIFLFWYRFSLAISKSKIISVFILLLFLFVGFSNDVILGPIFFSFASLGIITNKNSNFE